MSDVCLCSFQKDWRGRGGKGEERKGGERIVGRAEEGWVGRVVHCRIRDRVRRTDFYILDPRAMPGTSTSK